MGILTVLDGEVAVKVFTVGGVVSLYSNAPISQCAPCGRMMPRWSVAAQVASLPVSMADEPASTRSGMVSVKPP